MCWPITLITTVRINKVGGLKLLANTDLLQLMPGSTQFSLHGPARLVCKKLHPKIEPGLIAFQICSAFCGTYLTIVHNA